MENEEFLKVLSKAVSDKKIIVGTDRTIKLLKEKKLKLVGISSNCPKGTFDEINKSAGEVQVYQYPGTNADLGEKCRKPFNVAVVGISG